MKNKLVFEGSGLNEKQKQRVLEVLAQTPENFGFLVADDKYAGIKVWPKFRVEIRKPESLRNTSIINSLIFIPLIDCNLEITGFYEFDDSPSDSKHFYLDSKKSKEVSSHSSEYHGYHTFLSMKIPSRGKNSTPYYFRIKIPYDKILPHQQL